MTLLLLACTQPDDTAQPPREHPHLMVTADMREDIPRSGDFYDIVLDRAGQDYRETSLEGWNSSDHGHNGGVAQAAALLGWAHRDEALLAKAREGFQHLDDDWADNGDWDVNIRMAYPMMGYSNAHDLLLATDSYTDEEAQRNAEVLGSLNEQFYAAYVEDDTMRQIALGFSQNNHPIRTASTLGYTALLLLDEHPDAREWLDFALSEDAYLWGPEGHYVQPDGGISEGPLYYHFGLSAALPFFIAVENTLGEDPDFHLTCINRQEVEPWAGHGCVEGQASSFDNPLRNPLFAASQRWAVSIRLPWGPRPPLGDARFDSANGGPVLSSFLNDTWGDWDWQSNTSAPMKTSGGMDLAPWYLAYASQDAAVPPPTTTVFLPDAGNAVFRSSWDSDALWGLLVAEHGDARKTLHDHVDGTSFTLAAYGEYLLLDPGYYKPNELDNAVTAQGDAHNLILVDGQGPPDKGLLTDFGDTDAWLENTQQTALVDYAEARSYYQDHKIVRGVTMVRGKYFVISDRLEGSGEHEYTFRLNGYAGHPDVGGTFTLHEDGATWEREAAGVRVFVSASAPLRLEEPPFVEGARPHVHEFEQSQPGHHTVLDCIATGSAPDFLSIALPYRTGDDPLTVEAIEGGWRVGEDTVLWEDGSLVITGPEGLLLSAP